MTAILQELTSMIRQLPQSRQAEVRDFVEFLLVKSKPGSSAKLRQSWAGALRDQRDRYSPEELQKDALKWRADECT